MFKIPEWLVDFIAVRQVEFTVGYGTTQYIVPLMSFETFAMVLTTKLGIAGFWAWVLYFVIPPGMLIGMTWIGKMLIDSNYQHRFSKHAADVNKEWAETMKNSKDAVEILRRMEK